MALLEASYDNRNWFEVPTPKPEGYFPSYTHLEDSYNDSIGNVHRDFKWKNRSKVECAWNTLTKEKYAILQNLYDKEEFYLKFTDNLGNRVVKIMYVGSGTFKGSVYAKDPITHEPVVWTNITVNFIEKRR